MFLDDLTFSEVCRRKVRVIEELQYCRLAPAEHLLKIRHLVEPDLGRHFICILFNKKCVTVIGHAACNYILKT